MKPYKIASSPGGSEEENSLESVMEKVLIFAEKRKEELKAIKDTGFVMPSSEVTNEDYTSEDIGVMLKMMGCVVCNKIPSPSKRFRCPRGHFYCFQCGVTCRNKKLGCRKVLDEDEAKNKKLGKEYETLPATSEELLGKLVCGGPPYCRLTIKEAQPDALAIAIFNNSEWECPLKALGCKKSTNGTDVVKHTVKCMKKYNLLS